MQEVITIILNEATYFFSLSYKTQKSYSMLYNAIMLYYVSDDACFIMYLHDGFAIV